MTTATKAGITHAWAVPHPPILVAGIGTEADFEEARATVTAFAQVAKEVVDCAPEVLIVATPHAPLYRDCFHVTTGSGALGNWRRFGRDPERYEVSYDDAFAQAIYERALSLSIPCIEGSDNVLDHGVMVPLHFLLAAGLDTTRCKFVRIAISFLDETAHYRLGQCIQEVAAATGRKVAFIASGDLSHRLKHDGPYGFNPAGPAFDEAIAETFSTGDFARLFTFEEDFREQAGECGLNSFLMMAGVFDGFDVESKLYSYEGPWGVGYGIASFKRLAPNPTRCFIS